MSMQWSPEGGSMWVDDSGPQMFGAPQTIRPPMWAQVKGQWVQIPAFVAYGSKTVGGGEGEGSPTTVYYDQSGKQLTDPLQDPKYGGGVGGTNYFAQNPDGSPGGLIGSVSGGRPSFGGQALENAMPYLALAATGGFAAAGAGAAAAAGGAGAAGAGAGGAALDVGTYGFSGAGLGGGAGLQTAGLGLTATDAATSGFGSQGLAYGGNAGIDGVNAGLGLAPSATTGGQVLGTGLTAGSGGATGLTAAPALGTGMPSLGFSLTPTQIAQFTAGLGGVGSLMGGLGADATTASGIANTASAGAGLGGGSFLGGTDSGSLGNILSGLGTANGLTNGLGSTSGSWLDSLKQLLGGNGTGTGGTSGGLGNIAGSTVPGLLALAYAGQQPGLDTSGLQGVIGQLQGNQSPYMQSVLAPIQQNIATGYGDLLQSQGLRGIRGSSFGDTDIANYVTAGNQSLANAGAQAGQGSLALQGNLQGQVANMNLQNQQMKNNLYGNAFNVLGRGLNPISYIGAST